MTMKRIACSIGVAALGLLFLLSAGCPPHGTGGAGGSDADAGPPGWQTVYSGKGLAGAVLSAWGTGPDDIFVVGGPLGNSGFEAVAVHFDGKVWTKLAPGGVDSFWWVHGTSPKDVWMTGDKGRITHWDGATFNEQPRLTTARIWGLWAASPTDAWAVGGTPEGGSTAPNDVVLHWDGSAWKQETLPGAPLGRSLNKVWGTSSTDVYVVGEAATIWHLKGATWTQETNPAKSNLLTVHGCSATDVYAVGGQDVLHSDGTTWSKVDVTLGNSVNGVACGAAGEVLLVGFGGLKQRLVDGKWIDEFTSMPYGDLHGAWADGHGAFWAAGGDFVSKASSGAARKAIIGRYGPGEVPPLAP